MEGSLRFYKRFFFVFYVSIIFISGCVSDYDGKLPVSDPVPVLNGVLYADSVLKLHLTMSNQPWEKEFTPIPDAEFNLWKNGQQIFPQNSFNKNGTYTLEDTCRQGDSYKIEINIQGFPVLSSETVIPRKPVIEIKKIENNEIRRNSDVFNLEISGICNEVHAFYIFLFVRDNTETDKSTWEQRGIYCDSPFADSFNRFYDSWAPQGFLYEYESFIRFPLENLPDRNLQTRLAFIGGSDVTRFYVVAATKEYDLYYKGGYLQRSFDPKVNLPFTYQPVFLSSNIKGGAGIFSGIDRSIFDFEAEP